MKISIIMSMADNREELFKRTLLSYARQTLNKDEFELVIVDDNYRSEIKSLCLYFSQKYKLRFQYIQIDKNKSFIKPETFTPALTNNIGFKNAKGNLLVVAGPETIIGEANLEEALKIEGKKFCWYGLVYLSNKDFINNIKSLDFETSNFDQLLKVPGSKANCHTCPPHPPAYWYWMVANKNDVYSINGVDEEFMKGICGEDDDFANRMKLSGVTPCFNFKLIGIHQNHSENDFTDNHAIRFTDKWKIFRDINLNRLKDNIDNKRVVVNTNHVWGDPSVILTKEEF